MTKERKRMSFTDQKQRVATEKELTTEWGMGKAGENFRCGLCGYKFKLGDKWRWVYCGGHGVTNTFACEKCDGADVPARYRKHWDEYRELMLGRFWEFNGVEVKGKQ